MPPKTPPMKILLAYDSSPAADAAAEELARRPWPDRSTVKIVTVVDTTIPMASGIELYTPLFESVRTSLREQAHERIREIAAKLKQNPALEVEYEIREGSAKFGLLEAIGEWKPDLVVAGSHGAKGLSRILLGSVCHALVERAPCTVEVVKGPVEAA